MNKRFHHGEIKNDGELVCYGIEDTKTNFIYNVIGEGMYDVSEKKLIELLNKETNKVIIQDDFGHLYECDYDDYKRICEEHDEINDMTECLNEDTTICSNYDLLYNALKFMLK